MTPQVWPIKIGRIKLKTRVGPKSDLATKARMRQCAMLSLQSSRKAAMGEGR